MVISLRAPILVTFKDEKENESIFGNLLALKGNDAYCECVCECEHM